MKVICEHCQKEFYKPQGFYRNLHWVCGGNCLAKEDDENLIKEEKIQTNIEEEEWDETYDPMTDF